MELNVLDEKDTKNTVPVNNLYWVPVEKIHFMACSEGRPIQGGEDGRYLVRADSQAEAVVELSRSPGYFDNWSKLSDEERKRLRLQPFRFREGDIVKVLACDKRFVTQREDYTCGRVSDDGVNGQFGICCIESGFDIPKGMNCPYENPSKRIKPID